MTTRSLVACYLLGEVHIFLMMKKALPFLFLSVGEILFVLHVEAIVHSCLLLSVHIHCHRSFTFVVIVILLCCHCACGGVLAWVCVCVVAADVGDSPTIHWCSGLCWGLAGVSICK